MQAMKRSSLFVWATLGLFLAACGGDEPNGPTTSTGTGGTGGQGGMGGAGGAGGGGGMAGAGGGGGMGGAGGAGGQGGGAGGGGSMGMSFVPLGSYPAQAGAGNATVLLEDMNGDGKLDLVIANDVGSFLSVQLGAGNGSFAESFRHYFEGSLSRNLHLADMNGDGKKDVVVATTAPGAGVSILLSNGDGTLMTPVLSALNDLGAFTVADFDGDGDRDVVAGRAAGITVDTLVNDGSGKLAPGDTAVSGTGSLEAFAAGDLDGDEVEDVVAVHYTGNSVSWFKGGAGGLEDSVPILAKSSDSVALADLSGDGKLDLIVGTRRNSQSGVSVRINNGDGTFAPMVTTSSLLTLRVTGTADIDGDGDTDVLCTEQNSKGTFVFKNDGAGVLSTFPYSGGRRPQGLGSVRSPVLADLDGDGDADLTFIAGGNRVVVLLAEGGSFKPGPIVESIKRPSSVAVADVHGDMRPDLLVTDGATNSLVVLRNTP
jgi:hypothetical protein